MLVFWVCFSLLALVTSNFIHFSEHSTISLFFMAGLCSIVYVKHLRFGQSLLVPIKGNSATINRDEQVSV